MRALDRDPQPGDAFGAALLDGAAGGAGVHVLERDDGLVDVFTTSMYFAETPDWPHYDISALGVVAGRVLDVGAGAGRLSLALQQRGDEPFAVDYSAGAIEVCRNRGVGQTLHGTLGDLVGSDSAPFDAAAFLGHNLGILGSATRAPVVFDTLTQLVRPGGVVVGTCLDPESDDPLHQAYQERNLERGRLPGQIRLRARFRRMAGAWFDWLFVAPSELGRLAERSGWRLEQFTDPEPTYLAVLRPR